MDKFAWYQLKPKPFNHDSTATNPMSYGMLHHSNPYMDERADEPTKQVQNDEWPSVEEQLQYWRDKDYELEAGHLFLPRH